MNTRPAATTHAPVTVCKPILLAQVLDATCRQHGVSLSDVSGHSRAREIVQARWVYVLAARRLTSASYPEIARLMGRDYHGSVLYMHKHASRNPRLAAMADATIGRAEQGELFETDEDIETADPAEEVLFHAHHDDRGQMQLGSDGTHDDQDAQENDREPRASGPESPARQRKGRRVVPDASHAEPEPTDLDALPWSGWRLALRRDERDVGELSRLGVPDRVIAALRRAGCTEIRALAHPAPQASPGRFGALSLYPGVSTKDDQTCLVPALETLAAEVEAAADAPFKRPERTT